MRSLDGRGLPVEVDGSFVGEAESIRYGVAPAALTVLVPLAAADGGTTQRPAAAESRALSGAG